ncbi:MAG TPA: hypothetical protein VIJ75_14275 [Hanamia sp.]
MKIGKISVAFILTTILFSCNGNSTSPDKAIVEEHELISPSSADAISTNCYSLKNGKDTVLMKLNIDNGKVSGNLTYHYFEKDKNTGTLKGQMNGDTLFATYTFMSEGRESVRQIVFLKKGDEVTEGYGIVNSNTGEPDLTDRSAIKFDNKFVLKEMDCQ